MFLTKFSKIASSLNENNQMKSALKSRNFFWRKTIEIYDKKTQRICQFQIFQFPCWKSQDSHEIAKKYFHSCEASVFNDKSRETKHRHDGN